MVSNKVSESIGLLSKPHYYLLPESLLILTLQSYFDYYNFIWATLTNYHFKNRKSLQKKAFRIIAFAFALTKPPFKKRGKLTTFDTNKLQTCCSVYKAIRSQLHDRLSNLFSINSDVRHYVTRQRYKLHVLLLRCLTIRAKKRTYKFMVQNSWINYSSFYPIFKMRCMKYLLYLM